MFANLIAFVNVSQSRSCGVQNFMGDMFGQINNLIDSSLGGMFGQLNNIQGGGIALPSETFTKAIKFANIITNIARS